MLSRHWIGRRLRNPLVVVPVVVVSITLGWLQYSEGARSVAEARSGADLLPALQPATAGVPGGWRVDHSGDAQASLDVTDGHVSDHALEVAVTRYESGDVTLTSPRVPVSPGPAYLFKAYTSSSTDVTLLVRRYQEDGTHTLVRLRDYPALHGRWSTVSDAFDADAGTTAVEYVLRLASTGTLQVDGAYLEVADDVRVPPAAPTGPNLVPNPELAGPEPGRPDQWSPYRSGESTVEFGGSQDEDGRHLWTRIQDYRSGEAKWQYPPIPVVADRNHRFTATYRSDREVDVVAEFELAAGGRRFINLVTVPPAGEWTSIGEDVQVPAGAVTAMVTLVAHGSGTTEVRDLGLVDVTRPGPLRWARPLVSLTFDDGWQSTHDLAVPLLDAHGFGGTFYVNPATIETPGFMTAAQLQALDRAGHEIASHGHQDVDLTAIGADGLDEQLRRGRDELARAGLPTGALATPLGRSDPQVDWYADRYFETVRGLDSGINTRQTLDPHDLEVFFVDDGTTPEELDEALAETARSHGWLVLVYHQLAATDASTTDRSTVTRDVFAAHLDQIRASGIAVRPVSEAFADLQGQ